MSEQYYNSKDLAGLLPSKPTLNLNSIKCSNNVKILLQQKALCILLSLFIVDRSVISQTFKPIKEAKGLGPRANI